jgi:HSP20 family protein
MDDAKDFFAKLAGKDIEEEGPAETDLTATAAKRGRKKNNNNEKETEMEKINEAGDIAEIFDEAEGQLTIDVYQTPANLIVESAIAGVKPEDIDIAISADSVTVRGKREKEERVKTEDYFYQECYWGRFARSVILPQEIDPDRASASLKNGVLKIILPKVNKQKTKRLKIKTE